LTSRPKLDLSPEDLEILVEAIRRAEQIKPSQAAKREVFAKRGILGSSRDRFLTAILYEILKRQGIIDRAIIDIIGVEKPLILDPWLRASMRVALGISLFFNPTNKTMENLKKSVSKFLSKITHPFVSMYYWEIYDRIVDYKFKPRDRGEELELQYMLPKWFIDDMRELLGDSEAEELFKALNERLPLSLRVNSLKATVQEVVEELEREGKRPYVSEVVPTIIKLNEPYDLSKSKLYRKGYIVVQDEAAALASLILDPKPGEVVVDLCAAPGGKTSHIAELMRNEGVIHAFDIDERRVERMKIILRRMGITNVKIYIEDAVKAPEILGHEVADRVLLDPPCSSTGTFMKNLELRWRIHKDYIGELIKLQRKLLETSIKLLKPGGHLLYTTCSLLPDENEENIKWLLSQHSELELVEINGPYSQGFLDGTMRAWPHKHATTGFFYALLKKSVES